MPFEPGKSGNPGGRPSTREFADMLRVALKQASGDKTRLREVADALVTEAIAGNVPAIKEIADRLDGKATQPIEHSGELALSTKEQRDAAVAAATRANS